MARHRSPALVILVSVVFLAAAGHLSADVFQPIPATHAEFLSAMGGRVIYTSEAEVNGAAATLTAYGFNRPLESLTGEFQRRPALTATLARQETKQLFFLTTGIDQSISFLIEYRNQPPAKTPPPWPDMPQPAGAEALFSATIAATRTTMVRAAMAVPPAQAATVADTALRAKGWRPAAPATPSLALYQRRNATITVMVLPDETSGTATLTMLQRLGATAW